MKKNKTKQKKIYVATKKIIYIYIYISLWKVFFPLLYCNSKYIHAYIYIKKTYNFIIINIYI